MTKFSQNASISTMSSTMYNDYFYNNLWIDGYAERVPTTPKPTYDAIHVESVDWSDFMATGSAHELRQRFFKGTGTSQFDVSYGFTYNGYTDQNSTSGSSRAWDLNGRQVHTDTTGISWHTPSETVRFWLPIKPGITGTFYIGHEGFFTCSSPCGNLASSTYRGYGNAGIVGSASDYDDPAAALAPHTNSAVVYDLVWVHQAYRTFGQSGNQMTLLYYIR
jgi:hypothetical protein